MIKIARNHMVKSAVFSTMTASIAVAVSLARLYLKVHTRAQVIAGAFLGLSCACITLLSFVR